MCLSRLTFRMNFASHCLQENGLAPVCWRMCFCVFLWFSRVNLRGNAMLHGLHLNGLSFVWTNVWFSRCCFRENRFSQTSQENGLTPLCVFICTLKLNFNENRFPHTSQPNGFSFVWARWCRIRSCFEELRFPHSQHTLFSLSRMCSMAWRREGKSFLHTLQTLFFTLSVCFFTCSLSSSKIRNAEGQFSIGQLNTRLSMEAGLFFWSLDLLLASSGLSQT